MSLLSRDTARSVLKKVNLYPAARATYRLVHLYSGLIGVNDDDVAQIKRGLALLEPQSIIDFQKVRVGAEFDGGYVMLNDFTGISGALSLGIGWDMTWDLAIAEKGIPVLQFDNTIDSSPATHNLCRFEKRKIVASSYPNPDESEISIGGILVENNIRANEDLLLKIDIEGAEWDVFSAVDEAVLGHFRQIVCEFHGFYRIGQSAWRRRAFRAFEKLAETHAVVHVHGNNYQPVVHFRGLVIPEVLEVTFARRKDYRTVESRDVFPTELDRPNNPGAPDIFLGNFKFR